MSQPGGVILRELQQRVLDESTLLLIYAVGEARSFVWAVSRASIVSRELPAWPAIEAEARRFHEALARASA